MWTIGQPVKLDAKRYPGYLLYAGWIAGHYGMVYWIAFPLHSALKSRDWRHWHLPVADIWRKQFSLLCFYEQDLVIDLERCFV